MITKIKPIKPFSTFDIRANRPTIEAAIKKLAQDKRVSVQVSFNRLLQATVNPNRFVIIEDRRGRFVAEIITH